MGKGNRRIVNSLFRSELIASLSDPVSGRILDLHANSFRNATLFVVAALAACCAFLTFATMPVYQTYSGILVRKSNIESRSLIQIQLFVPEGKSDAFDAGRRIVIKFPELPSPTEAPMRGVIRAVSQGGVVSDEFSRDYPKGQIYDVTISMPSQHPGIRTQSGDVRIRAEVPVRSLSLIKWIISHKTRIKPSEASAS